MMLHKRGLMGGKALPYKEKVNYVSTQAGVGKGFNTWIYFTNKTIIRAYCNVLNLGNLAIGNYTSEFASFRFFYTSANFYFDFGDYINKNREYRVGWGGNKTANIELGPYYMFNLDTGQYYINNGTEVSSINSASILLGDSCAIEIKKEGISIASDGVNFVKFIPVIDYSDIGCLYNEKSNSLLYANGTTTWG